jgi:hypothetical protein
MAWVFSPDLKGESPSRYRSGIIKTKSGFLKAWKSCCASLDAEGEVNEEVITKLETISPLVAKELWAGLNP